MPSSLIANSGVVKHPPISLSPVPRSLSRSGAFSDAAGLLDYAGIWTPHCHPTPQPASSRPSDSPQDAFVIADQTSELIVLVRASSASTSPPLTTGRSPSSNHRGTCGIPTTNSIAELSNLHLRCFF
jgi:hypothetical protein